MFTKYLEDYVNLVDFSTIVSIFFQNYSILFRCAHTNRNHSNINDTVRQIGGSRPAMISQ